MASVSDDTKMGTSMENDMFGEQSEAEYSTAPGAVFRPTSIDYWYGKKYFEEIIARELFLYVRHDHSMSAIDARLQVLIHTFPYEEALQSLQAGNSRLFQANSASAGSDGYSTFLSVIGIATRHGTAQDKQLLLTAIERFLGHQSSGAAQSPHQRSVSPVTISPRTVRDRTSPPARDEETNNINVYMTMLKERADQRGIPLDYKDPQRVPSDPDTFRAELNFQGRTYIGLGRSKKQAKHQASKYACEYLDSQRTNGY